MEAHQEIVRHFPLSAIRIPQSGINSSVYFRSRYFICFVPALLRLSGSLFNHPGQLKMSEGVTACIALASTGGVEGSFFTPSGVRHGCRDIRTVTQT